MNDRTLSERLRLKASVMEMGEKIEFGSDTSLMYEAADKIDSLDNLISSYEEYFNGWEQKI